jgi:hypothetical protein
MSKEQDLVKQMEAMYNDLIKKEEELKKELAEVKRQMKIYKPALIEAGIIQKKTRKKKTPTAE